MSCLSIIIPVYNEVGTFRELLALVESVKLVNGVGKEIIIVDDCSTDGTREVLQSLTSTGKYKIFFQTKNGGKGSAIRTGLKAVTGDWVVIQDADLEYDPRDYNALLEAAVAGASVVYGSRELFKQDKRYSGWSFYVGGRFLSWLTNLLYGLHLTDEPTCYKLFKTELIKSLPLQCQRFEFCPEVTALVARRGVVITEVPIHYYPRDKRHGKKINWYDGAEAIWTLVKYRLKKIDNDTIYL